MVKNVETQKRAYNITTLYQGVIFLAVVTKDFLYSFQNTVVELSLKTVVCFILYI